MMRTLNTAATGMSAQQTNLDTIANNLSNVNTTGYKSQRAEFQDLMYQTYRISGATNGNAQLQPTSLQVGMGTRFSATGTDLSQGPSTSSNNPLDLAINGSGFFKITQADGSFAYTRDGSFQTDSTGDLVTTDGLLVSPKITFPAGSTSITVASDGTVSYVKPGDPSATILGQITVTTFTNPAGLQRVGQNLLVQTGASGTPSDFTPGTNGSGSLQSGYLEGSNVSVVDEMVKMISAQRAYEINSKAITTADDMLSIVNGMKR
jgi:flagellar basal-body rod protein FlgG